MNRMPIQRQMFKGIGYSYTGINLSDLELTNQWVILKESLERNSGRVVVPDLKNNVIGTVIALGKEAKEHGILVGDDVIYQEYMGGRWNFDDIGNCLIISIDYISVVLR